MRTSRAFFAALLTIASIAHAQTTNSISQTSGSAALQHLAPSLKREQLRSRFVQNVTHATNQTYFVSDQGGDYRVWQKISAIQGTNGQTRMVTNRAYVELASGLNYWDGKQWVESREEIDGYAGGAIAQFGQYKIIFANNLHTAGAIEMQTPDGKNLRSDVLGLSYYDASSGKSVLIGQIKDCQGQIVGSNQVVYANAFEGVSADVRYTYQRNGFAQDIILRAQPPPPQNFGLNQATTRLQVLTEFLNPPQPVKNEAATPDGTVDELLDFGAVQMVRGKAFSIGGNEEMPVAKQWTQMNGRTILVESVPVKLTQKALQALPVQTASSNAKWKWQVTSRKRSLPALPPNGRNSGMMLVAKNSQSEQGLVLDYQTVSGGIANYTFQGDTTYKISGSVYSSGTITIEGGTVLKFPASGASIYVDNGAKLVSMAGPYHMAVLTSVDDNSVGQSIGSGSPTTGTGTYLEFDGSAMSVLNHLRFEYAGMALSYFSGGTTETNVASLENCQFLSCGTVVGLFDEHNTLVQEFENTLISKCGTVVQNSDFELDASGIGLVGENITVDQVTYLIATYANDPKALYSPLKNSILTGVQNQVYYKDTRGSVSLQSYSVFSYFNSNGGSSSGVYQSAAEGNYYLAANCPSGIRGAGVPSVIDPALAAELKTKTTYPPIAFPALMQVTGDLTLFPQIPRDNNGSTVDLGYHYDPLDYTVANMILESASLTALPGTAVGLRNDDIASQNVWTTVGFDVWEGSSITAHGTPTAPITFTSTKMVQEEPETSFAQFQGANGYPFSAITFLPDFVPNAEGLSAPALDFRFCNFSLPGTDYHIWGGFKEDGSGYIAPDSSVYLGIRDCNLYGGSINLGKTYDESTVFGAGAVSLVNNLFDRVLLNFDPNWVATGDSTLYVDLALRAYNNLFRGGPWLHLDPFPATAGNWVFENNLFDQVDFYQNANEPLDYDYNGYWPLTTLNGNGDIAELAPTTTGDGFTDGTAGNHEVILSSAPPYQNGGPFGNYYMQPGSPLAGAGGFSPADSRVGLSQYTTRLNQTKELGQAQVDIGLHYVATASSTSITPKDTDGDGVPDYVEDANGNAVVDGGETDPTLSMTDGSTPDSLSTVYDDVDLSGDGLVGRIKKALGMTPLDTSNPLKLTQVTPTSGPEGVLFEVPLNYESLNGIVTVELGLGGERGPGVQGATENTSDGNVLLVWNSTFDPPGQHYLQPRLILDNFDWNSDQPETTAVGPLVPYESDNELQFDTVWTSYDSSGATLYAQTSPGAAYTIALTDPNGNPLPVANFTGNADGNGVIDVSWQNLLENDGQTQYAGSSFNAIFTIGDPSTYTETLSRSAVPSGDGAFTVAYSWQNTALCGKPNDMDVMIENAVVEPLWNSPNYPYDSAAFNYNKLYDPNGNYGDAGFVAGPADASVTDQHHTIAQLLTSLSTATGPIYGKHTKNFYWFGHGDPDQIMNGLSGDSAVVIKAGDVGSAIGNYTQILPPIGYPQGPPVINNIIQDAYRFVFVDGCNTTIATTWPRAFGIPTYEWSKAYAEAHSDKASAYVGFNDRVYTIAGPGVINGNEWVCPSYSYTLELFFTLWGDSLSLDYCMTTCSHPDSLWTYFGQEGVQDDFTAFPNGEESVLPIGRPAAVAPSGTGYLYNSLTQYYGTRYLTRTGVQ